MSNKRWTRMIVSGLVVIGVVAVALIFLTDTSAAQGPGGRRGPNTDSSQSGVGMGMMNQAPTCETCDTPLRDQLQDQSGDQTQNQLWNQIGGRGGRYGSQGQMGGAQSLGLNNLPAAVPGDLPDDVAEALEAGLMDEYNAYAVYQAVIDQFGSVNPFVNIQAAEAQHINALESMFARYDLPVPAPTALAEVPVFDSLAEACSVAAQAEVANFGLYDQWLDTVQGYPDLVQVFTALRNASEFSHLPAFENCAS